MISSEMSEELAQFYKSLWSDPAVQQTLSRSNEYQLYDSTELYSIRFRSYLPIQLFF